MHRLRISIPGSEFTSPGRPDTLSCNRKSAPRGPPMQPNKLTFRSIRARGVVLKLRRPIVARIMTISEWPLILIDLESEECITGRSYVGPYNSPFIKYLLPVIRDFETLFKGKPVAP